MSRDISPSDLVKELEHDLEELKRPPRTFGERLLAAGADFLLAVAFFALSIAANVVASHASDGLVVISLLVGVLVLLLWRTAREREALRDEGINLMRDARHTALIVDLFEALAKRQVSPAGSTDSSGGGNSGAPGSLA